MSRCKVISVVVVLLAAFAFGYVLSHAQSDVEPQPQTELQPKDKLVVVWTSGDREVALKMVFMYTVNAPKYGWWEDVTLIVWGPSAKLLSEDEELQDYIRSIGDAGVTLKACKACSDMYGVSEKLEALGVEVKYVGGDLSDFIKEGRHVLTF